VREQSCTEAYSLTTYSLQLGSGCISSQRIVAHQNTMPRAAIAFFGRHMLSRSLHRTTSAGLLPLAMSMSLRIFPSIPRRLLLRFNMSNINEFKATSSHRSTARLYRPTARLLKNPKTSSPICGPSWTTGELLQIHCAHQVTKLHTHTGAYNCS
jgi:hypothetical protein